MRLCPRSSGRKLTDDELELATLLIEAAEEEMQAEKVLPSERLRRDGAQGTS